jgi:hypothetical protein
MPVKAKYIKDLPLKGVLDGSESLLVQDLNGTQQAPLGTIVDEIKQNSQEKIREIESELNQTNAQLSQMEINKADKSQIQSLQKQVDSLVITSSGDSNAEVAQARTSSIGVGYSVINGRLNAIEDAISTGYAPFEINNLERGGISSSGDNAPLISAVRTKDYIYFGYETEFKIRALNEGYGSRIFKYKKSGEEYIFIGRTEVFKTNIITTNPNYYYKITFVKEGSTEQVETSIINNYEITVDILKPNYIFEKIETTLITGYDTVDYSLSWENGSINNTSGESAYFRTSIRTKEFYTPKVNGKMKFICDDPTLGVKIFWYEANGNYITSSQSFFNSIEIDVVTTRKYRFVLSKLDSSEDSNLMWSDKLKFYLNRKINYIAEEVKPLLNQATEGIEKTIVTGYKNVIINTDLSWEVGSINNTSGQSAYFPTAIRTKEHYKFELSGKIKFSSSDDTLGVKVFWYDNDDTYITSSQTVKNSVEVDVNSNYKYRFVLSKLETSESGNIAWGNTLKVELSKKPNYLKDEIEKAVSDYDKDMQNRIATAMIREKKRNPFEFKALDKGFVSFVFDDLRFDIDLVASIFAEFNLPLCVSAIPKNLTHTASGLKADAHGFTTGMKMKDILTKVQENGGEIFSHNDEVVNATNQYDFDFMYGYYVNNKKVLEDNGFNVRGLISAGGTGSITKTDEIEKWLILNYDYSNQGVAVNYDKSRISLNQPLNTVKQLITDAKNNKVWIAFMAHTLSGQEANITEANLREWLQHCKDIGVDVVTYAHVFDNYSSTKLENLLGTIG